MLTRRCHIEANPNMKMYESRDFILGLIASVQKRRCLWDLSSKYYSRRDKLEAAWREVSKEVGKPEKICREKWKNVRTGFLRSLKDFTPSGIKRRPFYLHNDMQFLLKNIRKEKPANCSEIIQLYTNDNTLGQPEETHQGKSENSEETSGNSVEIMDDNMSSRFSEAMEFFSEDIQHLESSRKSTASPSPKQERVSMKEEKILDTEATIIKYLQNSSKHLAQTSEERALRSFLKGVVPDVLSLSAQNQRIFKRKLVELIDDLHKQEEIESLPRKRNNFFWTDQHIPNMTSSKNNSLNIRETIDDGDEE